jgi:hypothetical protein
MFRFFSCEPESEVTIFQFDKVKMQSATGRHAVRALVKRRFMRSRIDGPISYRTISLAPNGARNESDRTNDSDTDSDWVKSAIKQILQTYGNSLNNTQDCKKYGHDNDIIVSSPRVHNLKKSTAVVLNEDFEKALHNFQVRTILAMVIGGTYFSSI